MNYVRNGWSLPNSGQLEIVTEPQQRAVSLEPGQVERAYFSVHVARIVLAERDHGSLLRTMPGIAGRTLHRAIWMHTQNGTRPALPRGMAELTTDDPP